MKAIALFFLLALAGFEGRSQVVNIQWAKCYGGGNADDAYDIQPTADGGYIVAGGSNSESGEVTGNHGGIDYWVLKLNDTGGIQWKTCLGGSQDDIAYAVQQTSDGGYIVAGRSESDSGYGDIPPQVISVADSEVTGFRGIEYDYWVVKLSPSGSIEWTKCYGGDDTFAYPSFAQSIHQTPDSGYIIGGETYSDSPEVYGNHSVAGSPDYWVVKTNDTGGIKWAKCYGGSGFEIAGSIRPTSDGGYIVAGESNSNDKQVSGNHGGYDYWVVKIDDTGALQWQKCLGGSGTDIGKDVIQTFDGGYLVTGASNSSDMQVTGNHGGYDYWVAKLNDTGGIQWEKSYGGSGDDWAFSVVQEPDSGYVVAGYSNSTDSQVTGNHGGNDYWVIKISKHGDLVWNMSLGGSSNDMANAVRLTSDTGVIVAGGTLSNNAEVSGNAGLENYWVVKLSPCALAIAPVIVRHVEPLATSIPYAHYQWYNAVGAPIAGATSATYHTGMGVYSVLVIDSNGCMGMSLPDTVAEGVPIIPNSSSVHLSPNPTDGIINITGLVPAKTEVYDEGGNMVTSAIYAQNISIAKMPPGVYVVKLFDDRDRVILIEKVIRE